MARGRMLSATIAGDHKLNSMSIEAEYLFLKTIPHLDRDGLVYGKPNLLWAKACPERMELFDRIDELVNEWIAQELVLKYNTRNGPVIYFYGFIKNQGAFKYDREAPSIFDCPPGAVRGEKGIVFLAGADDILKQAGSGEAEVRTNSGLGPDEVCPNTIQSNIKESNAMNDSPPSLDPFLNAAQAKYDRRQNGQPVYGQQTQQAEWNLALHIVERKPIVEAIATVTGKRLLWEAGDERIHTDLHEAAITAHRMGYTAQTITAKQDAWKADWRGKGGGSVGQFLTFLSEQHAPATKATKKHKRVALEE